MSIAVPIFKKWNIGSDELQVNNIAGINIETTYKHPQDKLNKYIHMRNEQQCFRENRSTTDANFI